MIVQYLWTIQANIIDRCDYEVSYLIIGFSFTYFDSFQRDSTLTRHLGIYDIKSMVNIFSRFFLKILVPIVTETRVGKGSKACH